MKKMIYILIISFTSVVYSCNQIKNKASEKQFEQEINLMDDTTLYIYNEKLPVWIIPISGWEENSSDRMNAYILTAKKMKINIEFSTKLGTPNSYKYAPQVAKEIDAHNEKTFEIYRKELGEDWEQRFLKEVDNHLK